jgi:hypothetical protein
MLASAFKAFTCCPTALIPPARLRFLVEPFLCLLKLACFHAKLRKAFQRVVGLYCLLTLFLGILFAYF